MGMRNRNGKPLYDETRADGARRAAVPRDRRLRGQRGAARADPGGAAGLMPAREQIYSGSVRVLAVVFIAIGVALIVASRSAAAAAPPRSAC